MINFSSMVETLFNSKVLMKEIQHFSMIKKVNAAVSYKES